MAPDGVLQRYPGATVRFLRARLGLSRAAFARRVDASAPTVAAWESGRRRITLVYHRRIVPLLAPQLATDEGRAWLRALVGEEEHRG